MFPPTQVLPLIPFIPNPILVQLGPVSIGWYGVGYVVGLAAMLFIAQYELARRGYNPNHIWNALLLVGALALIGGRLYHVIDQWGPIYSQDPLRAILPPYAGLGLYGGVAGAVLGIFIYTRWKKIPLPLGLDVVAAGALFAQGIARWGNFFNQELYGPPTDAPWAIAIDCAHRVAPWLCPPQGTFDINTGFQPLFLYESILDILGGVVLLVISRRYMRRLHPGDLAALWGIWYGLSRAGLETLRTEWDWKIAGIPTAILIGIGLALFGVVWILYNHPRGKDPYPYLPPWTPEIERQHQLALAGATAGAGTVTMAGGTDSDDELDDEYDDDEFEDEEEADELDDEPAIPAEDPVFDRAETTQTEEESGAERLQK